MANRIYNSMFGNQNIMSALQSLKQNPVQFLAQKKYNIPDNIQNDPNAIIQHLMNTGQVSQSQYNRMTQMMRNFM